jgi:hypothetical protein
MNKVGLNWGALSADNQWIKRITGKLQGSKDVFAHNTTELKTTAESSGPSMAEVKAASQDSILAEIDTFMRNLPYTKGFAPRSWKLITDVEILKKAGVYDVEKMRTIQLMHPVFNMTNIKLGRDMMRSAEANNILAREQFGSRKHHQSIISALNK